MTIYQTDPACNGTGMIGEVVHALCGGTGRLPLRQTCPTCGGEGLVPNEDAFDVCPTCFGAGVIPVERLDSLVFKWIKDTQNKVDDVMNKCNDVLDKCNDILEEVQNP